MNRFRAIGSIAVVAALTLVVMSPSPRSAQSALELLDGRIIAGVDVRRDGGIYVLTLESGQELAFPVELVRTVRLIEERAEDDEEQPAPPLRQVAGQPPPPGPSGLRAEGPESLAGGPVSAPRTSDQLAAFGESAKFQKNIIDNRWTPSTDWNMDPNTQNNFNPARWAEAPIDSSWQPESAWGADSDALQDSRSSFSQNIIDPTWTPTDAFADSPANR